MLSADRPPAATPPIAVERVPGFPADLDILADAAPGCRGFLRAAWFAAAADDDGETLIARRACGTPILAIPTTSTGPALLGLRAVPGSYWPFRSVLVAPCASEAELARAFSAKAARAALTPIWRLGPVYADDPALARIKHAAGHAGWTVLQRPAGRAWLVDLSDESWPRRTTRRRLANYEKQLAATGAVRVDHVSGEGWSEAVLATLATIEANSWIARTDRSGAKFLAEDRRAHWMRVIDDPVLAAALSATILTVGDTPAAFSFDLRAGSIQYAIASSYDERFTAFSAGKIVTRHQLDRARAEGVTRVDLGAGDSGYKQEMGARAGSEIVDLLVVRSRPAAALLRYRWGKESAVAREGFEAGAAERGWELERVTPWLAAGAIAAAAFAMSE